IHRIEFDRLLETNKHPERLLQGMKARMRYRYAAAHAGRSELLALLQFGEDQVRRQIDDRSGPPRKLFQKLLLVGKGGMDRHIGRRQEVRDFHDSTIAQRLERSVLAPAQSGARRR